MRVDAVERRTTAAGGGERAVAGRTVAELRREKTGEQQKEPRRSWLGRYAASTPVAIMGAKDHRRTRVIRASARCSDRAERRSNSGPTALQWRACDEATLAATHDAPWTLAVLPRAEAASRLVAGSGDRLLG